jgi:hypothetical protein
MCPQKFNFMLLSPFDVIKRASLAEKLATVKLCSSCPYRMFTLPKYAWDPKSVEKYDFIFRNLSILRILLGDEETRIDIHVKASMLRFSLAKPKTCTKSASELLKGSIQIKRPLKRAVLPVLTSALKTKVGGRNPAGNASSYKIGGGNIESV